MGTVRYTTIAGEVMSENRNGVIRDYLPDSLGSTVGLLDNTQTITDTFEYWPYGEVRTKTGTNTTPLQFVGTRGYHTDSSSKNQVRARTLDSQKGRWMTKDPIGFAGRDWNLYRYAGNMPILASDPSGLLDIEHPSDQAAFDRCKRLSPGACFECAYFLIRWWTYRGQYQGDWRACIRTNIFCGSHINCRYGGYPDNPIANPNPMPLPVRPGMPGGLPISIIGGPYPFGNGICDDNDCLIACHAAVGLVGNGELDPIAKATCKSLCGAIQTRGCDGLFEYCGRFELEEYRKDICMLFWKRECD